jgi:oligopeptide/dipeptide ABC transporter ATP-binding protein
VSLLEISDLAVRFAVRDGAVHAVRGVDVSVDPGEVAAIVGESGSGKSATMLAALGLLDENGTATGSVRFDDVEMVGAPGAVLRSMRGGRIGMIFQDPMTSLNPVLSIGRQIGEAVVTHQRSLSTKDVRAKVVQLLELASFPDAARRTNAYPHELSGGMRQRVMIAMALANDPDILIADEPTTALDVTVQAQILEVLRELQSTRHLAIVLITHDLGVVAGLADTVHVMYAGRIVESGPVVEIFHRPRHPYTSALLASLPRLDRPERELVPIGGTPPSLAAEPTGCPFAPRCPHVQEQCRHDEPPLVTFGDGRVSCHVLPFGSPGGPTAMAAT